MAYSKEGVFLSQRKLKFFSVFNPILNLLRSGCTDFQLDFIFRALPPLAFASDLIAMDIIGSRVVFSWWT